MAAPQIPAQNTSRSPRIFRSVSRAYTPYAEDLSSYKEGGFHPVHLNEYLGPNRRFRIVNKLGNGTYGVVWLCYDSEDSACRWKAVKINRARTSTADCAEIELDGIFEEMGLTAENALANQIAIPYTHFWTNGPNGRHLCSVLPVLGPNVLETLLTYPDISERQLCRQVVLAMKFLHKNGINHGDFRPDNILTQVEGLQFLNEREIREVFGMPRGIHVSLINGGQVNTRRQPRYLVPYANLDMKALERIVYYKTGNLMSHYPKVAVVDFGSASHVSFNRTWNTCIPREHLCPAVMLGYPVSFKTDIFALGITLCLLLTNEYPFLRDGADRITNQFQDYFPGIEEAIGPMPNDLRRRVEERAKVYGFPNGLRLNRDESCAATASDRALLEWRREWVREIKGAKTIIHGQMLEAGMSMAEADAFQHLLEWVCAWNPADRPNINQVCKHPFLTGAWTK